MSCHDVGKYLEVGHREDGDADDGVCLADLHLREG